MRENFFPTPYTGEFGTSILIEKLMQERGFAETTHAIWFYYQCPKKKKTVAEAAHAMNPVKVHQLTSTEIAIVEFANKNFGVLSSSDAENSVYSLKLIGELNWMLQFKKDFSYETEGKTIISWAYMSQGSIYTKEFEIDEPLPLYDEFYPYIEGGVNNFFERYFKSKSSILILIGEPGTGKTSLIRDLIWKRKLKATVTFDERVMAEESYFVNYASNSHQDLMIVEDADLLLSSRQSDQNKLMAKLLNISDGLIRLDRKKMIFSTNLSNVNKIDPALVRSGRCFDIVQFRPLTNAEAKVAAAKAGIELATDKKEVTLAEVFNTGRKTNEIDKFKLLRSA